MNWIGFLKKNVIWIGVAIIVAALLVNLYVQYHSLQKLGEALPATQRVAITKRLALVDDKIQEFYRSKAKQAFDDLSPALFRSDLIDKSMTSDALDEAVKAHFEKKDKEGVKKYFILTLWMPKGLRILAMYDTTTGIMLDGSPPREGWAAFAAGAPWMTLLWRNLQSYDGKSEKAPGFTVHGNELHFAESDPENPIILKPVTNEHSHLIGIAGLVIDKTYFREKLLPQALGQGGRSYFTRDDPDLALAAFDDSGNVVASTKPITVANADLKVPLSFVFPRWYVGIKSLGATQEVIGRRYLLNNLSLTLLMTGIIIGAIIYALRAASREMKLSQMKTDFVSNVSHELRTPLSSIRVFGELQRLGRVRDQEKVREYGEYIETESRRLTQLINNILDFSRIESGQKTYRFQRADVTEVVHDALKTFDVRLQQDHFNVKVESSSSPLPPVILDPEAIGQVIVNLLDNAVKYSGTSRDIIIRIQRRFEFAMISVTDFGVGIPAGEREKIFERFHRVSTGLVHDVKGSGLGLSLVKHIVEAHGGTVSVQSEIGRGSTFTVALPCRAEEAAATQQEQAVGPTQSINPV
jgi:signal transduction histidine kinase